MQEIQQNANFPLHKWVSNSPKLIGRFGSTDWKQVKEKSLQKSSKALGIKWDVVEDTFRFDLAHLRELINPTHTPTKTEMLCVIMSLFDPLGLVAFLVVIGRLIMRETWKLDCEFHELIPEAVRESWSSWMVKLQTMGSIRIPRWSTIRKPARELHIFVDASERALAAVAYMKGVGNESHIVSLAASKCKLAPMSQKSIPRLELQAAVLGVRLAEMIRTASSVELVRVVFWTDAQNNLWWINSANRRYKQYVALRIAEILSFSKPSDWRYVPSALNPADIATKPTDTDNSDILDKWFNGPAFLREGEDRWPITTITEPMQPLETLKVMTVRIPDPDFRAVADPIRVGTWSKLVRATAYARRFMEGSTRGRGQLSTEEMECAETELYREAQREFSVELAYIKSSKKYFITTKGELKGLNVFLDKNGIMRYMSRNVSVPGLNYDTMFPIVMPRRHPITKRILEHYHRSHLHESTQTVLNEIRQRFLIRRCRTMINKIIRDCQWCAVNRAKPVFPQMANHPRDRMALKRRAFSSTGVDLFGPIYVKVGRSRYKRWGVLFTCLTTRAVHLELAHSLSGESCVRCIQNFANRRGIPRVIRSDNGTNFVWASKYYKDKYGRQPTWKFIPPAAPSQGGAWERLVRSVKRALSQMEIPECISDEELQNFLIKAESLINARPLTEVPTHPSQPALTPNHFLFGNSTGEPGEGSDDLDEMEDTDAVYERLLIERDEHRELLRHFWSRWSKEYLPLIAARCKWQRKTEPLAPGDLVFICEDTGWIRGVIEEAYVDPETEQVREVIVQTTGRRYRRPASKVAKIRINDKEAGGDNGDAANRKENKNDDDQQGVESSYQKESEREEPGLGEKSVTTTDYAPLPKKRKRQEVMIAGPITRSRARQ